MWFDGRTYEPAHDQARLSSLLDNVRNLMLDGRWRTLSAINRIVGGTEASVSARLRDLRKERFGAYMVERRREGEAKRGIFSYRVTPSPTTPHSNGNGQALPDLSPGAVTDCRNYLTQTKKAPGGKSEGL